MNVLVTGGCGYIGGALVPELQARGHHVTVLDALTNGSPRNLIDADVADLTLQEGDVRHYGAVERAMRDADAVVHLAAITGAADSHDNEAETFEVNLDGTRNVVNAAEKHDVDRIVFASSCNVYGRATSERIDESVQPEPINPYAESKLAAEGLLTESTVDTTALRLSTVYGHAPGIRFNLVVNDFVVRGLTGRPLTVYGDGSNWRPFIHVEDAANAFAHATANDWPEAVYNVGANGENYRIRDVADVIRTATRTSAGVTYLEDEYPGPSYNVCFDRLGLTDFETEWTLEAGVQDLADRFASESEHAIDTPADD